LTLKDLLIRLGQAIDEVGAKRVVLDIVESLFAGLPNPLILRAELRHLFRWLKDKGVTAIITSERGDASLTRQGLEKYVFDCVIVLDHRFSEQRAPALADGQVPGLAAGRQRIPFFD
jgi:circadian clock protein KaiC